VSERCLEAGGTFGCVPTRRDKLLQFYFSWPFRTGSGRNRIQRNHLDFMGLKW